MSAIILFEEKQVRRAWSQSEGKWYFSIDDVVEALTGSVNVKDYFVLLHCVSAAFGKLLDPYSHIR